MNVQLCTHKTIRYHCTVWTHIEIHASVDTIVCIWERNTQKVTEWVHNGIVCVYAIHKWMKSIPGKQCAILFNICRRLNSHKCRIINEWRENIFDVRPWNCVMAVYFPCRRMHTHTHTRITQQQAHTCVCTFRWNITSTQKRIHNASFDSSLLFFALFRFVLFY